MISDDVRKPDMLICSNIRYLHNLSRQRDQTRSKTNSITVIEWQKAQKASSGAVLRKPLIRGFHFATIRPQRSRLVGTDIKAIATVLGALAEICGLLL